MKEKLKNYFPTIREREELLLEIQENVILQDLYEGRTFKFLYRNERIKNTSGFIF